MTQLRLAYVNLKVVSKNSASTRASSAACAHCSSTPLLPLARKAQQLQRLRPRAAAVIEQLVDDALARVAEG